MECSYKHDKLYSSSFGAHQSSPFVLEVKLMSSLGAYHRPIFLAYMMLLCVSVTSSVQAGAMYVYLVVDPPTTAGAGIAPILGGGSTMVVSSTRSGPGTWHLYAIDDTNGSAGIRSFFVKLNGSVLSVSNRSPLGNWDDQPTYGDGTEHPVGFDNVRTTTPLLGGSLSPTDSPQIGGYGITAGNFQAATSAGSWQATPTSGQWGNYADPGTSGSVPATGHVRNALFLGEGLYTGAAPTVDITTSFSNGGTGFSSWIAAGFPNAGSFTTAVGTVNQLVSVSSPEPRSFFLLGLALVGFGGMVGRRRS
jgi:hypothetical protein